MSSVVMDQSAQTTKKIPLDKIHSITPATKNDYMSNYIDGTVGCGIIVNGMSRRGKQTKLLTFEIILGSSLGRMKRDDAVQNLITILLWNRARRNEDPNSIERVALRKHLAVENSLITKKMDKSVSTASFTDESSLGTASNSNNSLKKCDEGSKSLSKSRSRSNSTKQVPRTLTLDKPEGYDSPLESPFNASFNSGPPSPPKQTRSISAKQSSHAFVPDNANYISASPSPPRESRSSRRRPRKSRSNSTKQTSLTSTSDDFYYVSASPSPSPPKESSPRYMRKSNSNSVKEIFRTAESDHIHYVSPSSTLSSSVRRARTSSTRKSRSNTKNVEHSEEVNLETNPQMMRAEDERMSSVSTQNNIMTQVRAKEISLFPMIGEV